MYFQLHYICCNQFFNGGCKVTDVIKKLVPVFLNLKPHVSTIGDCGVAGDSYKFN